MPTRDAPADAALQKLKRDARMLVGGKGDKAALALAHEYPDLSFLELLTKCVKPGDLTVALFERFSMAHDQARLEREVAWLAAAEETEDKEPA